MQSIIFLKIRSPINMDLKEILENDSVRIMLALFLQIWLSVPIRMISKSSHRYIYSFFFGTLLQFIVFGCSIFYVHLFALAMYLITICKPDRCGSIVTVLSILFLSCYHFEAIIYRYGAETMDAIVLLMIMVCKFSLFAFSIEDGYHKLKSKQNFERKQRQLNMIIEKVSVLQYFGYIQFLPTAVMGPPIEYRLYERFMEIEEHFHQIPSILIPLRKTGLQFLICAIIYFAGLTLFPPSYMKSYQFLQSNSLFIFIYSAISITFFRFKFYSAWKMGIASVHSSGISFEKNEDFTSIKHCNPQIVQLNPQFREKVNNWNMMVQQWLRKCVYMRSPFRNKDLSQLYVFMVSAFWHGFYAGFYFSFFNWFIILNLQTQVFKFCKIEGNILTKIYNSMGKAGPIIVALIVNLLFSHQGSFFYLLQSHLCFKLMARVYYIPQLIPLIALIVFMVLPKKKKEKLK